MGQRSYVYTHSNMERDRQSSRKKRLFSVGTSQKSRIGSDQLQQKQKDEPQRQAALAFNREHLQSSFCYQQFTMWAGSPDGMTITTAQVGFGVIVLFSLMVAAFVSTLPASIIACFIISTIDSEIILTDLLPGALFIACTGFVMALPLLLLLAYPTSLFLISRKVSKFYKWTIPFTAYAGLPALIALITIPSSTTILAFCTFSASGFLTGLIMWRATCSMIANKSDFFSIL